MIPSSSTFIASEVEMKEVDIDSLGPLIGISMKDACSRAMAVALDMRFTAEAFQKGLRPDGRTDWVTQADIACQAVFVRLFTEQWVRPFGFGLICEEQGINIPCTIPGETIYWTVDPIDGTSAYKRQQSGGFGPMCALVRNGEVIAVCIGDAATGELYYYRPGFFIFSIHASVAAVMARSLDGRALAERIRKKIKTRVAALPSQPGLAVLLVGADPASHTYVGLKRQACEEAGIHFEQTLYFATEPEKTLIKKIEELNEREDIHGILVQLPLPGQNADRVIAAINPLKDVDGFHPGNLEKLKRGEPCIASAVALGIIKLIDEAGARGHAVIVSSQLFAAPLQILLQERGVDSTVVQAETSELAVHTRQADILIVAKGIPGLITGDMVKPGATVIDVGTTRTDEGLKGDVDFESVEKVVGAITPVPGGVGPMTVAMLLVNILKAYDLLRKT